MKKARILIVDDEEHNLEILADFLEASPKPYQVIEAINGKEALEIMEAEESFDLILTDWNMPVMNGLELLQHLKQEEVYAQIPVIMQTANTEDAQLKQAFDAGAVDYIRKPVTHLELLSRVDSVLELNQAKKETEELLLNILPAQIAEELRETGKAKPKHYPLVSVLFTDFKGFTQIAEKLSPQEVIEELDACFLAFDEICEKHHLEKIKTIGDSYMCAGGLPLANETNPVDCVRAGLEMQAWMQTRNTEKEAQGEQTWKLRLGIHSGELMAGVVGKNKFAYDIWGDTVNLASRMESAGEVNKVNISEATYELIKTQFTCVPRGKINAKHKGEIEMYFVEKEV